MVPHIFHIEIYFIFLREWKLAVFRLLINCFHIIQNLEQARPAVVQTSFVYDDERLLFKQTYLKWRSTLWEQWFDDVVICRIQVTKYILDYQWIFDARYNFNRTTALFTGFYFYPKNPFKSLRLGHRPVLLCSR